MSLARLVSAASAASILVISAAASAQEVPAPAPAPAPAPVAAPAAAPSLELTARPEPRNSINLNPLGVLSGVYSLNYQYMFAPGHAVLIEGDYASASGSDADSSSWGGLLGYRWFLNGTQNSWFLGASVDYSVGNGTATLTTSTTTNGSTQKKTFSMDVTSLGITGNFGKRWQLDSGLNVTFRLGAGYGKHTVDAKSNDPDAKHAEDTVNDILSLLPFAVDGELSLGYSF